MGIAQHFKKQTLKYMYLTTVLLSDKWPGILRKLSFSIISIWMVYNIKLLN